MIRKAGAIIIKDKRILIVRSKPEEMFVSPGGMYETNETYTACLTRKVRSELGVELYPDKIRHFATYKATTLSDRQPLSLEMYRVEYEGTPQASQEIAEIRWAKAEEIIMERIDVASGLRRLVLDLEREGFVKGWVGQRTSA